MVSIGPHAAFPDCLSRMHIQEQWTFFDPLPPGAVLPFQPWVRPLPADLPAPTPGLMTVPRNSRARTASPPKCPPYAVPAWDPVAGAWGCHNMLPNKKEKKGTLTNGGILGRLLGATGEIGDSVGAIIQSMPAGTCKNTGTIQSRVACVLANWRKINPGLAGLYLIGNHFQDKAIGKANRLANTAVINSGYYVRPVGIGFGNRPGIGYATRFFGIPGEGG